MSTVKANSIINAAGQAGTILFQIFTAKIIYQHLGPDVFGIYFFAFLIASSINLSIGGGLKLMMVRELSMRIDASQQRMVSFVQTMSLTLWAAFLGAVAILYAGGDSAVTQWINLASLAPEIARPALLVLIIAMLLPLPTTVYISVLEGAQKMGMINIIQVLASALQLLGVAYISLADSVPEENRLYTLAQWTAIVQLVQLFLIMASAKTRLPCKAFLPIFHIDRIKPNMNYAIHATAVSFLSFLNTQIDKLFISRLLPIAALGYYNIVHDMASKVIGFSLPLTKAAYPQFCHLHQNDELTRLSSDFHRYQDILCYGGSALFGLLLFAMIPILSFILSAEQAAELLPLAVVIISGFCLQLLFILPNSLLFSTNNASIVSRLSTLNLFITTPISFLAIYNFGLVGAGWAFLLTRIFGLTIGVPLFTRACFQKSAKSWYIWAAKLASLFVGSYGFIFAIVYHLDGLAQLIPTVSGAVLGSMLFVFGASRLMTKDALISVLSVFSGIVKLRSK